MISKTLKHIMLDKNVTAKDIYEQLSFVSTAQGLTNKLYKDNFTAEQLVEIADVLGFDVVLRGRFVSGEYVIGDSGGNGKGSGGRKPMWFSGV